MDYVKLFDALRALDEEGMKPPGPANIERRRRAPIRVFTDAVRVATPVTLCRMKKDTLRPVDRMDAEALRRNEGLRVACRVGRREHLSGRSGLPAPSPSG